MVVVSSRQFPRSFEMASIANGLNGEAHEEFIGGVRVGSCPSISPHSADQGLDVAASYNEPIASPLRRQPAGPDPSTNRFSRAPGDAGRSLDVQLVRWR